MKTKFFNRLIVLGLAVMTIGNLWGQYTITFKTGSGDGSGVSTSTACSTIVSDGSSYLSGNVAAASNAYDSGDYGLKLGTSRKTGSITLNLSSSGQVKATSIVVNAKQYNSKTAATISINGASAQSLTSSFANYTFTLDGKSSITSIQISSSKYAWVSSVTVNYSSGDTWTLAGFDDWSNPISLSDGKFTKVLEAKTYTYNTSAGFKLIKNGSTYYGCNGTMTRATADGISWTFYSGDGNNNCGIIADVAGTYTFALDASGSNPKVTVTYPKVLSSISVKTAPTKVDYEVGETFNPAGLVIKLTYNDASTEDVAYSGHESSFSFNPSTSTALQTSHTKVTITYGGKSLDQNITVKQYWTVSFVNSSQAIEGAAFADRKIEHNGEVGTLPTLTSSDACDATSRVFMGWTTQTISSKTSTAPTFVTATTKVTQNMVLRAVWARQR